MQANPSPPLHGSRFEPQKAPRLTLKANHNLDEDAFYFEHTAPDLPEVGRVSSPQHQLETNSCCSRKHAKSLPKTTANFPQLLLPTFRVFLYLSTSPAKFPSVASPANFSCQLFDCYFVILKTQANTRIPPTSRSCEDTFSGVAQISQLIQVNLVIAPSLLKSQLFCFSCFGRVRRQLRNAHRCRDVRFEVLSPRRHANLQRGSGPNTATSFTASL